MSRAAAATTEPIETGRRAERRHSPRAVLALVLGCLVMLTGMSPATAAVPALAVGKSAWVAVSVATVWKSPTSPRAIDKPALANPAGVRTWLKSMSNQDRLGLVGRAETQALLGDRVVVTRLSGSWAKVVVPDQPTPKDSRGYPGWVPIRQLTAKAPPSSALVATVVAKTTWLRTDSRTATPQLEISFATRLPYVGRTGNYVRVVAPGGKVMRVWYTRVKVTKPTNPALPRTGADVVRTAQMFTGLPYLWAGRSGFGFDCSGLTSLVYRARGVTIPRDADAQAVKGTKVATSSMRAGDLLFYARNGVVHHVGIYAGAGKMVEAPRTGLPVRTVTAPKPYTVRRYLP